MGTINILWILCIFYQLASETCGQSRSFTIGYDNNTFLKDGKPFQYISGSLHYSRVPYYYWADRLKKMFAGGLDAVQTYITWNLHEPMPGVYDFAGQQDIGTFFKMAQDAGLVVILRAGPYVCGEWEYGGLPAWLLSDNSTFLVRTMNSTYIKAVDRWMSVLLPVVKPWLYSNGGPVIMVQIENEYGSYAGVDCGHDYMSYLRDTARKYLGNEVVLFTTDGNGMGYLKCGAIDGVYATVDFGPTGDVPGAFAAMRQYNPKGPLVNSEFYTGWLDYWGGGHSTGDTNSIVSCLTAMHKYGANVNMYMFEGGTNFGFTNGADPTYSVCPTSYDYDSPLNEAGDITTKYLAIRNYISQFKTLPPVPANTTKTAYGAVQMTYVSPVLDLLSVLSPSTPFTSVYPLNMEQAFFLHGFVLYRHVLTKNYGSAVLNVPGIRDRGYVLLDGVPHGLVDRNGATALNIFALQGQTLDIIVENMGRINFGADINMNKKGIISNVTVGGDILSGWSMYSLNFTKLFTSSAIKQLRYRSAAAGKQLAYQPTVYTAQLSIKSTPNDTFIKMCGWFKGQIYINGFNLGRYWPSVGPQVTLYVPAGILYPAPKLNTIIMLELEHSPSTSGEGRFVQVKDASDVIELVDTPIINAKCFSRDGPLIEMVGGDVFRRDTFRRKA